MKRLFVFATLAVGGAFLWPDNQAQAQGVHLGLPGVHVDVGRPHAGYYGGRGYFPRSGLGVHSYRGPWGGFRGHSDWHDTSHYDVHPGGYQRHYNHFDYSPRHYDFHSQGHWDYHH